MSDENKEEKRSPQLEVRDGGMPERFEFQNLLKNTFLDVHGENYMGSGLGFSDWMRTLDILRYERWYGNQVRDEKKRRMGYLIALCAEQERLVATDISATGLSASLIECLIEGDWNGVKSWMASLTFKEDKNAWSGEMRERFAKFVAFAQEAYDTRPKVFCPLCRKPTPKQNIGSFKDGRHECPWCHIIHDDKGNAVEKDKAHLSPVEDVDG